MVDIARFFTWIGMACIIGLAWAGGGYAAHLLSGGKIPLDWVTLLFVVPFAVTMLAGSLCCAAGREL